MPPPMGKFQRDKPPDVITLKKSPAGAGREEEASAVLGAAVL